MSCDVSGIDVHEIPGFEGALAGRFAARFRTHVPPSDAPISMRLGRAADSLRTSVVATCLTGAGWKRVAYSTTALRSPALATMSGLTVVMMECIHLERFLATDVLLPARDQLCIEVSGGLCHLPNGKTSAALLCAFRTTVH